MCQLVSYLTWRTYHPWYRTHKQTHIRAVRHTCSLHYGRSRHTRTFCRLSLYTILLCILYQVIELTKFTLCWWHVYFYKHISGVWSLIKFFWLTVEVTRIFIYAATCCDVIIAYKLSCMNAGSKQTEGHPCSVNCNGKLQLTIRV